jgi:predicted nucleic acid-binding protein
MNPLLEILHGKKVALDTMIFIYAFEEHPVYLPLLKPFWREVERGKIRVVTSTITLVECLVLPFRAKALELAARYKTLFRDFPHLSVIPVSEEIAEKAAWLRAQNQLKTPDALQMATALDAGCHAFLTNDEDLPELKEVRTLVLSRFLTS